MPELQYLIFTVIVLALIFDFINGFHDTANAIATSVSTRAIRPQQAIIMAAFLNFVGAMYSTGVAKTIGGDIVSAAELVDEKVIIAALVGAIIWNIVTWWLAVPSSSSHALVGGLIGAVLVSVGSTGLNFYGIGKIIVALIASPVVAIVTGCIVMNVLFVAFGKSNPHIINSRFKRMQILSAAAMAFSHGSNDAQKSMGWRIIKTIGGKIFKLEPISGFAADLNSSIVIFSATLLHLPVSTTHVVSGSIMGVGTAKRVNAVRWGVAQQMVTAWVLTIPCTALMGAAAYQLVLMLF